MFGPCIDKDGKLRGVIQLFNKKVGKIDLGKEEDEREFELMLGIVAEIIGLADREKYAAHLVTDIRKRLKFQQEHIVSRTEECKNDYIFAAHAKIREVNKSLDKFVDRKEKSLQKRKDAH